MCSLHPQQSVMIPLNLLPTHNVSLLQLVFYEGLDRLCEWFYVITYDIATTGKCVPRSKRWSYKTGFYILFKGWEPI